MKYYKAFYKVIAPPAAGFIVIPAYTTKTGARMNAIKLLSADFGDDGFCLVGDLQEATLQEYQQYRKTHTKSRI